MILTSYIINYNHILALRFADILWTQPWPGSSSTKGPSHGSSDSEGPSGCERLFNIFQPGLAYQIFLISTSGTGGVKSTNHGILMNFGE